MRSHYYIINLVISHHGSWLAQLNSNKYSKPCSYYSSSSTGKQI